MVFIKYLRSPLNLTPENSRQAIFNYVEKHIDRPRLVTLNGFNISFQEKGNDFYIDLGYHDNAHLFRKELLDKLDILELATDKNENLIGGFVNTAGLRHKSNRDFRVVMTYYHRASDEIIDLFFRAFSQARALQIMDRKKFLNEIITERLSGVSLESLVNQNELTIASVAGFIPINGFVDPVKFFLEYLGKSPTFLQKNLHNAALIVTGNSLQ